MEKLLNSLRALCLSSFTVSRWMDSPNPRGAGRIPVQDGASHRLPGAGYLPSAHSLSLLQNPSSPTPSRGCGRWKGKATQESDGNRRGSDRLEALSSGTVSSSALSSLAPGQESVVVHWEVEVPFTCASWDLSSQAHHLCASLGVRVGPRPEEGTGPRQRGRGSWLHHTQRATDSGISETNLTLVFWHIPTVKIKAGLQRLRSSDWWYIFFSHLARLRRGEEKRVPIIGRRHRVVNASTLKLTVQCFWHFINSFFFL